MSVDMNQGSAPSVHLGQAERPRYDSRGFVPGKGHPSVPKKWEYLPKGPAPVSRKMGGRP